MDAKEFLAYRTKICDSTTCAACKARQICADYGTSSPEMVDFIEKWSQENPLLSNSDKFEQVFGRTLIVSNEHPGYMYLAGVCNINELREWYDAEYKSIEEE